MHQPVSAAHRLRPRPPARAAVTTLAIGASAARRLAGFDLVPAMATSSISTSRPAIPTSPFATTSRRLQPTTALRWVTAHRSSNGEVPPGTIRVIASRSSASVPGCPDWARTGRSASAEIDLVQLRLRDERQPGGDGRQSRRSLSSAGMARTPAVEPPRPARSGPTAGPSRPAHSRFPPPPLRRVTSDERALFRVTRHFASRSFHRPSSATTQRRMFFARSPSSMAGRPRRSTRAAFASAVADALRLARARASCSSTSASPATR